MFAVMMNAVCCAIFVAERARRERCGKGKAWPWAKWMRRVRVGSATKMDCLRSVGMEWRSGWAYWWNVRKERVK